MVYTIDEIKTRITPVAEKYGIPALKEFCEEELAKARQE